MYSYNSFEQYLLIFLPWGGTTDAIGQLITTVKVVDQEFWCEREWGMELSRRVNGIDW